jgi:hypothetical protein
LALGGKKGKTMPEAFTHGRLGDCLAFHDAKREVRKEATMFFLRRVAKPILALYV